MQYFITEAKNHFIKAHQKKCESMYVGAVCYFTLPLLIGILILIGQNNQQKETFICIIMISFIFMFITLIIHYYIANYFFLNWGYSFIKRKEIKKIAYDKKLWDLMCQIHNMNLTNSKKRKLFLKKTKNHPLLSCQEKDIYTLRLHQDNIAKLKKQNHYKQDLIPLINEYLEIHYPNKRSKEIKHILTKAGEIF